MNDRVGAQVRAKVEQIEEFFGSLVHSPATHMKGSGGYGYVDH